jgi:tRNA A37 threonylcarbamoyladenosine synthetase subunit TsaC/SUA5/YrdC
MAQFFSIHPTHPQKRLIRQAADIVQRGGVIAYPTDSCYARGCDRGNAKAWSGCGRSAASTSATT